LQKKFQSRENTAQNSAVSAHRYQVVFAWENAAMERQAVQGKSERGGAF
jgi:hypothetical protein